MDEKNVHDINSPTELPDSKPLPWSPGEEFRFAQPTEDVLCLLKHSVEYMQDMVMWIRGDGAIVYVNSAAVRQLGYTREELLSMGIHDFDTLYVKEIWDKAIDRLKTTQPLKAETQYRRKDGSLFPVEVVGTYLACDDRGCVCAIARDISERKLLEESLQASRDEFRLAFENSVQAIMWASIEGQIINCNTAAETLFEMDREDILGKQILELHPGEISEEISREIQKHMVRKGTVIPITEIQTGSGARKSVRIVTAVTSISEKPVLQAVYHDITEEQHREKQYQQIESRFALLLKHSPDLIMIVSRDGRIEFLNRILSGKDPQNFIGKNAFDYLPEKFHQRFTQALTQVFHFNMVDTFEHSSMNDNDTWWTVRIAPVKQDDVVTAALIISTDITQRKRMELALQHSRERLKKQFQGLPIPTYIWRYENDKFILKEYNEAAFEITKGVIASRIGKTAEEIFEHIPDITDDIYTCYRQKTTRIREMSYPFQSTGQIRNFVATYAYIPPDTILVHTEDVTDKRRVEEELQKALRLEAIGVLAGGIAHDFNNLLLGITGNLSMVRKEIASPDNVLKRLDLAETACDRAGLLTKQLLTFARGGEPVRITMYVEQVIRDSVEFALSDSGITCDIAVCPNPKPVSIDPGQFTQVLANLISNARHAMSDNGNITIQIRNFSHDLTGGPESGSLPPGQYVTVAIQDSGSGITPEHVHKIFDPYYTTKSEGIGLGLAISYSIIKKHDGVITVDSIPDQGTTFTLYLPVSDEKIDPVIPVSQPSSDGEKGRILFMDDNDIVREATSSMLQTLGYQVVLTQTGAETVDIVRQSASEGQSFDILLLDITIPGGMGGVETMKELLKISPDICAVVTSGYSDDPVLSNFRDYGFSGCIAKPFSLEELRSVLERVRSSPH